MRASAEPRPPFCPAIARFSETRIIRANSASIRLCFHPSWKKSTQRGTILAPGLQRQLCDLGKLPVVVGKLALAPVVHHQEQIRPVLRRGQVAGVAEIIADIKGHPGTVHGAGFTGCGFRVAAH